MHHGIYIMGCIWQPFWILQEKLGISCYFWIIRVVNSQLALYNHVICNPLHTWNTPQMTITTFNYEGSYLPGVICNIVVKADLGISPGRSTPNPLYWHLVVKNGNFILLLTSSGQEWQLADLFLHLLADLPLPNASWYIYYGMYLAAILDSFRKCGNFLLYYVDFSFCFNNLIWHKGLFSP